MQTLMSDPWCEIIYQYNIKHKDRHDFHLSCLFPLYIINKYIIKTSIVISSIPQLHNHYNMYISCLFITIFLYMCHTCNLVYSSWMFPWWFQHLHNIKLEFHLFPIHSLRIPMWCIYNNTNKNVPIHKFQRCKICSEAWSISDHHKHVSLFYW
jgi:hypothetical protein